MKVDLKPKWVCVENSSDEVESGRTQVSRSVDTKEMF